MYFHFIFDEVGVDSSSVLFRNLFFAFCMARRYHSNACASFRL